MSNFIGRKTKERSVPELQARRHTVKAEGDGTLVLPVARANNSTARLGRRVRQDRIARL